MFVRFQYDPKKAKHNIKKHEISFADAEGVFCDPLSIHQREHDVEDEDRHVAIGMGSAGQILIVIYTIRGKEIRLISARRATRREVKQYES